MTNKEYRERIERITRQTSDPQVLEYAIENLILDLIDSIGENNFYGNTIHGRCKECKADIALTDATIKIKDLWVIKELRQTVLGEK